jgi:hypothetical protein
LKISRRSRGAGCGGLRKERDKEIERYKGEGNIKKMREGDNLIKGRVKEDVGMECERTIRKKEG